MVAATVSTSVGEMMMAVTVATMTVATAKPRACTEVIEKDILIMDCLLI